MSRILPYVMPDVTFLPADPDAFEVFAEVKSLLAGIDAEIEHIGSTSIPGMPGKNSINVLVAVDPQAFQETLAELEALGFQEHPVKVEPDDRPLRVGGIEWAGKTYWLHVHVMEKGSPNHLGPLFFRDYLRKHPEAVAEYAALKEGLATLDLSSEEYNAAKQPFIRRILSYRPTV